MPYDPRIHHRRSIRLKGFYYTQPGAYFVTLVTKNRESLFGEITDGDMRLNEVGKIVHAVWVQVPNHFPIRHDEWIIMPNHLHGIIFILGEGKGEASANRSPVLPCVKKADASPLHKPIGTLPGSLGAIIQNFKSISTRKINKVNIMSRLPIWQRDYYEHIVRNEVELNQMRRYIQDNPLQWIEDEEYPAYAQPFRLKHG